jgi:thymidine kinase
MFAAKSKHLIEHVQKAGYASLESIAIKPKHDTRSKNIMTRIRRGGQFEICGEIETYTVATYAETKQIIRDHPNARVLAIDEVQFFEPWFVDFVSELLEERRHQDFKIYLAGLDMNYRREPFGIMPHLMAIADEVHKCTAVCFRCSSIKNAPVPAIFTQVLKPVASSTEVGDAETYEARCRACHIIPDVLV